MITHVIPTEDRISLHTLEDTGDISACIKLISHAISKAGVNADEDANYELGAAHLWLSIYQLISNEIDAHRENMKKANELLPKTDLLALAAAQLDRIGGNEKRALAYCNEFFDVVDPSYKQLDGISRMYFEAMEERRERLLAGR